MSKTITEQRRACGTCAYLTARVSWWCTNSHAIQTRGTAIPGVCHCPYWKPNMSYIRESCPEDAKAMDSAATLARYRAIKWKWLRHQRKHPVLSKITRFIFETRGYEFQA